MEKKKKKGPGGQPTKYREEYCDLLIEHFDIEPTELIQKEVASQGRAIEVTNTEAAEFPTFAGFAKKIGVHMDTLREWRTTHDQFSASYKKAKAMQQGILIQNAMKGRYNTAFACFFMKNNFNWADKVEQKEESSQTIQINYSKTE